MSAAENSSGFTRIVTEMAKHSFRDGDKTITPYRVMTELHTFVFIVKTECH